MKIDIENIAKEKGGVIADKIFEKYGENPVIEHDSFWGGFLEGLLGGNGYSRFKVEKEVYQRCLQETNAFFINNSDAKFDFDEEIIEILKDHLQTKLQDPKVVKKMTTEDMFAHLIKIYVKDFLLEKGLVL
ncbi:MAG TPA: hypothetical protein P5230_02045 [Candidatus Magasanikbacteria bacterium]|nr:hypothetical protein [Candidatus Magasanikbacteria bacterium]